MGQCCGLEKRVTMNEVAGGEDSSNKGNPYLELKGEDMQPHVEAQSINASSVADKTDRNTELAAVLKINN